VVLPVAAAAFCGLRYALQQDSNVWSKTDLHLQVPDPDLGFRQLPEGVIWLGLDSIAVCLLWALAIAVASLLGRRRGPAFRNVLWAAAALPLVLPVLALLQGGPPAGARSNLPPASLGTPGSGIRIELSTLAPGEFEVLPHKDNAVTASLEAGGERFDARWSEVRGHLASEPIAAFFTVPAAGVNSQLGERDKHIRDYLRVQDFPEIRVELVELKGLEQEAEAARFAADATVKLMGKTHPVDLQGTLRVLSPEAKERLGVLSPVVLLLQAQLPLDLASTAIESPSDNFDSLEATIHVTLLLHKP